MMLPLPAGGKASSEAGAFVYERHRPERTVVLALVTGNKKEMPPSVGFSEPVRVLTWVRNRNQGGQE